jgi:hypothetical protein
VANADYHHRQARTILLLAASTRDRDTAAALIKLAGEHTALANAATAQGKPFPCELARAGPANRCSA